MKLVLLFENTYQSSKRLLPRDIRNYLGAITKENSDINSLVMWHERKQPPFIFPMPNPKSAAVYTFKDDMLTQLALENIKILIEKNPTLVVNNNKLKIKEVFITNYDYTNFKPGLYERRLRTPMVISSSVSEYAQARKITRDKDNNDLKALEQMVKDSIINSVRFQSRDWFGEEYDISESIIKFKDLEYCPIKYKENEDKYYPAVRGTIISNIELPQFIGYKCGLGFGELSTLKEMDRRKGKVGNEKFKNYN